MATSSKQTRQTLSAGSDHLQGIATFLRDRRENEISLIDVVRLAEVTAESLQTFFQSIDKSVYAELREIAEYIGTMKQEIGALQPNDLKNERIPAAGQELDAIVKSTEEATNAIMTCAEEVMCSDPSDAKGYYELVNQKMMEIFEACSFQDITGQRVAKVVETLKHIENRVTRFANVVQAKDSEAFMNDDERKREERRRTLILNGPTAGGVNQNDVDAMFGR